MTKFVYVTYIRAPMEKIFDALIKPEIVKKYWAVDCEGKSDWKVGSPWAIVTADGRKLDEGEVLEFDRPRKFSVSWRHLDDPDMKAEGISRWTCELEQQGSVVKLTLTHENSAENSKLIGAVSQGWQSMLSALKTWLETGEPIAEFMQWPRTMA